MGAKKPGTLNPLVGDDEYFRNEHFDDASLQLQLNFTMVYLLHHLCVFTRKSWGQDGAIYHILANAALSISSAHFLGITHLSHLSLLIQQPSVCHGN